MTSQGPSPLCGRLNEDRTRGVDAAFGSLGSEAREDPRYGRLNLFADHVARPPLDPQTWVLDLFKIERASSCAAVLIPARGCIAIQLVATSPTEAAQRLIRRATASGPAPNAVITDMSEDWAVLRGWLESCGTIWIGSQTEIARLERYASAIFRASANLRNSDAFASIRITC